VSGKNLAAKPTVFKLTWAGIGLDRVGSARLDGNLEKLLTNPVSVDWKRVPVVKLQSIVEVAGMLSAVAFVGLEPSTKKAIISRL